MITREMLDEIIKRRYDEGKTMSIEHIDDEVYSKWQIMSVAKKYYGGWASARNAVVGVSKYGHKPEMSKEDVVAEIVRLQSKGHSMKSSDFEPWFYRRIVDVFGGYKQAKKELGIESVRKKGGGQKAREISEVRQELRGVYDSIRTKKDFYTKHRHIAEYSRRHFGCTYEIFRKAGLEIPKDTPRKRKPRYWTEEQIKIELGEVVRKLGTTTSNQFIKNGYESLVGAVRKQYGTWNAGLVALGYEVAYEYRNPDDNLTKEETKEKVLKALATGVKPTREALEKEIQGLKRSIDVNFGGIAGLKEYCGYCTLTDKPSENVKEVKSYRPKLTTPEGIHREIIRMWYIGAPMNYTYVSEKRRHVLKAANERIGSWREAVESVGINYNDVSKQVTTNALSECGTEFEEIFAEILNELGYEFIREGEDMDEIMPDFKLKPDFILPNWRWIDCKLSEWTDIRETIIRYHDEKPNGITIVYLRGRNRRIDRGQKWKYEHVSVYQFTKLLPRDRREYYENRLREIERKADEGAIAS